MDSLLFTDDASSHLSGNIISQYSRTHSAENPHALHDNSLLLSEIGVWCAVSRRRIVGPFFSEETITVEITQTF